MVRETVKKIFDDPLTVIFGITLAVFLVVAVCAAAMAPIPQCATCGQPEYYEEFDHFQTILIGDPPFPHLIPINRKIYHSHWGERR